MAAGAIWGPGLFIIAWTLGGIVAVDYSSVDNPISDLAAFDAPTRVLMTIGLAAVAVGVGMAAWPLRRLIGTPAAIALGLNTVCTLGVMFTPTGRSGDIDFLHAVFAVLAYLSLSLAGLLASIAFFRRGHIRRSVVSLAVGVITLAFLGASLGATAPGLFQRLGLSATHLWLIAVGIGVVAGRIRLAG